MIVGNGVRLGGNPNRFMAAPLGNTEVRANWNRRGSLLNIYTASGVSKRDGIPSGMRHPQVWLLPIQSGALASRLEIAGTGLATANLAGGRGGTATLTGVGDISGSAVLLGYLTATLAGQSAATLTAAAIGQSLATLAGTGALTPSITSVLNAVAALAGSSTVSADAVATLAAVAALGGSAATTAYLVGAIAAAAALAGDGSLAAVLNAITPATAGLAGSAAVSASLDALGLALAGITGTATLAGITDADGFMHADISLASTGTELTPESVAAAVRSALMGTTLDGYTIQDIIKLTSSALLGKSSGGSSPVFRSMDDTADRISGEVDTAGNRLESVLTP